MGAYIYTMRQKNVSIMFQGVLHQARFFSYSYKPGWGYTGSNYERDVRMSSLHARRAFESYTGGLVILGDESDPEGCQVYTNVQKGEWLDTFDFPGRFVGFVRVARDGRLYMAGRTKWTQQGDKEIQFSLKGYKTR